jgi:hypothetical protein
VSTFTAFGLFCGALSGIIIAVLLGIFVFKRTLGRLARIGVLMYSGHVPTWGAMGNALMEIQRFAQPQYEYVLAHNEDETKHQENEDEGGPDDP